MLTTNISTNVIIGLALVEILNGELTDQTIQLMATIQRDEVPAPLDHLVGFIQGSSISPEDRNWLVTALLQEVAQIALEEREKRLQEKKS